MASNDGVSFSTLRFVGRMNAHLSHDIKNVTATVSETAWLLGDLTDMLASGGGVDPARIKTLSTRIAEQMQAGNALLKLMNAFAHSTDEPERQVDLRAPARLMAELASCLPFARKVNADLGEDPVEITTRPYLVEQFLYLVFRAFFESMDPEDALTLTLGSEGGGCRLTIGPLPKAPDAALTLALEAIAAELGGESLYDAERGGVILSLPDK
jgi:hypothetical protein